MYSMYSMIPCIPWQGQWLEQAGSSERVTAINPGAKGPAQAGGRQCLSE